MLVSKFKGSLGFLANSNSNGLWPPSKVWGDVLYAKHVHCINIGQRRPFPFNFVMSMSESDLMALSDRIDSGFTVVQNLL